VDKALDGEDRLEVDRELVVVVGEDDVPGEGACAAPLGDGAEAFGSLRRPQLRQLLFRHVPGRAREDEAAVGDARQERRSVERPPAPGRARGESIPLQRAEKPVKAEAPAREGVRGGEARDHPPAEPFRPQLQALALHGDEEVGDGDPPLRRDAGAAEERDLVLAQHGPDEDVPDAALGQVDDLGEQRVGLERLLGPHVIFDDAAKIRVRVAEAAEERGARGADDPLEKDADVARVERLVGTRGDAGHDGEGPGQREWRPGREGFDVARAEDDLPSAVGQGSREHPEKLLLPLPPRDGLHVFRGKLEVPEERRGPGGVLDVGRIPEAPLVVERLDERHLPFLPPFSESVAERGELVGARGGKEAADDLDPSLDLTQDRPAERRPRRGLDEVDLEEALELGLARKRREALGDGPVAGGWGTCPARVERLQRTLRPRELLRDRHGRGALGQPGRERRRRLRPGHRHAEVGDEDLRLDEVADVLRRFLY
jgi:hypothetical protein